MPTWEPYSSEEISSPPLWEISAAAPSRMPAGMLCGGTTVAATCARGLTQPRCSSGRRSGVQSAWPPRPSPPARAGPSRPSSAKPAVRSTAERTPHAPASSITEGTRSGATRTIARSTRPGMLPGTDTPAGPTPARDLG